MCVASYTYLINARRGSTCKAPPPLPSGASGAATRIEHVASMHMHMYTMYVGVAEHVASMHAHAPIYACLHPSTPACLPAGVPRTPTKALASFSLNFGIECIVFGMLFGCVGMEMGVSKFLRGGKGR